MGTYFCLFLVELRGLWAHLTSISHLTSKPTHNASRHPAQWRQWEDVWYRTQEAWPRCHLQAYAGGGYVVACRHFRLRVNPPAKKIDQNLLIKRSRNAIPRPFQPKPSHTTFDFHVFRDWNWVDCSFRPSGQKMKAIPPPPPQRILSIFPIERRSTAPSPGRPSPHPVAHWLIVMFLRLATGRSNKIRLPSSNLMMP